MSRAPTAHTLCTWSIAPWASAASPMLLGPLLMFPIAVGWPQPPRTIVSARAGLSQELHACAHPLIP